MQPILIEGNERTVQPRHATPSFAANMYARQRTIGDFVFNQYMENPGLSTQTQWGVKNAKDRIRMRRES